MSDDIKKEEVVDEVVEQVVEETKIDRPEENYKAEIERKNREIERMRDELARRQVQESKPYNANDITTWPDHELKALMKDPQYSKYHEQAEDILFERKMDAKLTKRMESEKRVSAEMQLREKFPDALDPTSKLAVRMEQLIQENDLAKTPAGRLVAARLAAAELGQGKNASDARAHKAEKDRVASVKGQMVDGDRAKPTNESQNLDQKRTNLAEKLKSGKDAAQVEALGEILKDRFGSAEKFFKKDK